MQTHHVKCFYCELLDTMRLSLIVVCNGNKLIVVRKLIYLIGLFDEPTNSGPPQTEDADEFSDFSQFSTNVAPISADTSHHSIPASVTKKGSVKVTDESSDFQGFQSAVQPSVSLKSKPKAPATQASTTQAQTTRYDNLKLLLYSRSVPAGLYSIPQLVHDLA